MEVSEHLRVASEQGTHSQREHSWPFSGTQAIFWKNRDFFFTLYCLPCSSHMGFFSESRLWSWLSAPWGGQGENNIEVDQKTHIASSPLNMGPLLVAPPSPLVSLLTSPSSESKMLVCFVFICLSCLIIPLLFSSDGITLWEGRIRETTYFIYPKSSVPFLPQCLWCHLALPSEEANIGPWG